MRKMQARHIAVKRDHPVVLHVENRKGKNSKVFRDPSPERFHDVRELLAQDQLQQADNLRHTLEQADRAADDALKISQKVNRQIKNKKKTGKGWRPTILSPTK
eukprot:m.7636 g.7636  ORF g.7636 m.7636 type:complete len:103 (+) comp3746_c0_seq1:19-327(+)